MHALIALTYSSTFAVEDVKLAAIEHYSEFLKVFDREKRENLLEVLVTVQRDQHKWRIRQMIASQIDKLTEIYEQDSIFSYIMPITMKLCNDIVSSVRQTAAQKAYVLVLSLQSHEIYFDCVVQSIIGFSLSSRFNQRQTFVQMCQTLMQSEDLFKKHFLGAFQSLSDDKIINVRIAIAQCLAVQIGRNAGITKQDYFRELEAKMRNDPREDVRNVFVALEQHLLAERLKGQNGQKKFLKVKQQEISPVKASKQERGELPPVAREDQSSVLLPQIVAEPVTKSLELPIEPEEKPLVLETVEQVAESETIEQEEQATEQQPPEEEEKSSAQPDDKPEEESKIVEEQSTEQPTEQPIEQQAEQQTTE